MQPELSLSSHAAANGALDKPGWRPAGPAPEEARRQAALRALAVLDTPPEPEFDALVEAASMICDAPVSLITLVDAERQWFKANRGFDGVTQTPRDQAFCAHAILHDGLFVVPDATLDERFYGNPLVTGEHGVRFYAGAPVQLSDGIVAGTLCVIDRRPRHLDASQRAALSWLALAAGRALEGRRASIALERRNAFLDNTLSAIADAVLTTDFGGRLTWMNPAAESLLGARLGDVKHRSIDAVLPLLGSGLECGWHAYLEASAQGRRTALPADARWARAGADAQAIEGSVSPLAPSTPQRAASRQALEPWDGAIFVLRDTTAARLAAIDILHRATHDALTGLVNRSEFERRLEQRLATAVDAGPVDCALFIDLDHFKIVNDSCGHGAGDRLLQQIAIMLRESMRAGDTVARMGGDEFAILLEHCPQPAAFAMAQRICDRLERFRFAAGSKRFQVGACIGLAPVGGPLADAAAVMQAVDECCYAAKNAGRNRVVAWQATPLPTLPGRGLAQWAERIGRALDDDSFVLYGQLVMPLHDDAGVEKVEVLLRMRDEAGQIVAPGAFMPTAERFQLMNRIDRWVLRHTLQWMADNMTRSRARRVGVNLSGQSIGDANFREWAIDALRAAGPARCAVLTIEVTETVALSNIEEASRFLQELRALGLRIALDDFGAGASSFGYLKRLPLDYLKIDGQFVRDLLVDPLDEAAVRCFVDVARVIGLKTVAECVETAEVLARLEALGVDFAQGYHLHRPEPLDQLCDAAAS